MGRWRAVKFGDVLTPNRRPITLGPTQDADLIGVRWYGEGAFHREKKEALKIQKKDHFVVRAGDVVYNKLFAWKGSFAIIGSDLDGMFASDKFPTYKLDEHRVDPGFLKWFFKVPGLWENARIKSKGSAAISKLTLNPPDFLELEIPLPDLDEQRSIRRRLDLADDGLRRIHLAHQRSEDALDALLSSARDLELSTLPLDGVLGDVLTEKPRNGWSPVCDNADEGTAVLALGAVTGFRYQATEFKRSSQPTNPGAHYWLSAGDLLVTRSNTPELVGHAAIYSGSPSPCIYPDLMMRLTVNAARSSVDFVHLFLQGRTAREFIQRNAKGTSPTMKKINQGTVMSIPFPVSASLQRQGAAVDRLRALTAVHDRVMEQLKVAEARASHLLTSSVAAEFGQGPRGSAETRHRISG